MDYYYCLSCWRDMEKACCMTCARLCHKGHELVWTVAESGFICDCWSHSCCARKSKDTKFEFLTIKQTNRQSISLLPYNSEKIQEAEPGTLECMTPFEFTVSLWQYFFILTCLSLFKSTGHGKRPLTKWMKQGIPLLLIVKSKF